MADKPKKPTKKVFLTDGLSKAGKLKPATTAQNSLGGGSKLKPKKTPEKSTKKS